MKSFDYIFFHLPLLQQIFKDPENAIGDIFDVGIYNVSQTLEVTETNAMKQAVYCYYQGGLTGSIFEEFEEMEESGLFVADTYQRGFNSNEFMPVMEMDAILQHSRYTEGFMEEIMEFHRLRQAKDILRMKYNIGEIISTFHRHNIAYDGFKGQPTITVKNNMMLDYYEHQKTDHEKALFAMYAGIRSIIGNKPFAETTGNMIKCRMFGAKNNAALENILSDKKVKAAYGKYTTDYHYKKMLKELLARNFLMSEIGFNRRTYVSCKLSMQELEDAIVEHVRNRSLKSRVKKVEASRLESVKSINRRLNNK